MNRRFVILFGLFVFGFISNAVMACELEKSQSIELNDETFLQYRFTPEVVPIGEHFSIDILFCQHREITRIDHLKVDALMPAHAHGMNYRPVVVPNEAGHYRAQGLLFHMPGHWQITLEITIAEERFKPVIDQNL